MSYEYDENNGLQPKPPKKNNNDLGSWIFIAVMFAVAWPVGLILLLSKLSEGGGKKKNVRTYAPSQTGQRTSQRVGQSAQAEKARSAVQQMTRTPEYTDKGGRTMRIIGAILGILGCMALFSAVGDNLSYAYHYNEWWYFLRQLFYPLGMLAGRAPGLSGPGGQCVPPQGGEGCGPHAGEGAVGRRGLYRHGQRHAVPVAGGRHRVL